MKFLRHETLTAPVEHPSPLGGRGGGAFRATCLLQPLVIEMARDAETFTGRLANLRQDIAARQDTSGDKFTIALDGQMLDNRRIAGELIVRLAEEIKDRFGDDVRLGRFAGYDWFLRPGFNNAVEVVVRGKNSYGARVTDTALGTIRSLEASVQGFEERAAKPETDIVDAQGRGKKLETKGCAPFEHEER